MIFENHKIYDTLKFLALIIVPLAALILKLSEIWGFAYGEEISSTLLALDVFLGAIVKASSDKYAENKNEPMDS